MDSVLQFIESLFGWSAADFWSITAGTGGYTLWSLTHFVMIGAAVFTAALFGVLYAVLHRRGRKALQIVITSLSFVVVLAYQAELIFKTGTWSAADLPLGVCGLTLLFMLLNTMNENGFCSEWLFAAALPMALLSLCFPSWRALPVWSCAHLCLYLLPTLVLIYAVMNLCGNNLPSLKRLPAVAFALLAIGVGFYFLNPVLKTNFWGLTKQPAGLPWTWFAKLFGKEWYLLGLPSAAYVVWFVTYLPVTLIANAVSKSRVSKRLKAAFEDLPDISAWDKPAEENPAPAPAEETAEQAETVPAVVEINVAEAEQQPDEQPAASDEMPVTQEIITEEAPVVEAQPEETAEVETTVPDETNDVIDVPAEAGEQDEIVQNAETAETAQDAVPEAAQAFTENGEAAEPSEQPEQQTEQCEQN